MLEQPDLRAHMERMVAYARSYYGMEEIGRHTKTRRDMPLALEELNIISIALTEAYNKLVRKCERSKQPRTIKETQDLREVQETLQYVAFLRTQWIEGREWKENRWEACS